MTTKKVAVLGCSGMLGSMVSNYLSKNKDLKIIGTLRNEKPKSFQYPDVEWKKLDAENVNVVGIEKVLEGVEWVINCIGIIKPYIHDDNAIETERAISVNALFPHLLAKAVEKIGTKVIQIATDCVYSGLKGKYTEQDNFDVLDVYGKTKNLGEVYSPNVFHLRCSIIGPEIKSHLSLMDWFLAQPKNAEINGFSNHKWNGITTFHFAKLCEGIIEKNLILPRIQHIIPQNKLSKAEILDIFKTVYGLQDIKIKIVEAPIVVNRTLSTNNSKINNQIWFAADYKKPPTIQAMIRELYQFGVQ